MAGGPVPWPLRGFLAILPIDEIGSHRYPAKVKA
jgi:hypothetical protein